MREEDVEKVKFNSEVLNLDNPSKISRQIEDFIKTKVAELERNGVILGLSGGVDSILVANLCVMALGHKKVASVYLPEKESKFRHQRDAERAAKELGIFFEIMDLAPVLESIGIYDKYPMNIIRRIPTTKLRGWFLDKGKNMFEALTGKDLVVESRKGSNFKFVSGGNAYVNIKHRIRMGILHYFAEYYNLLTVGCANQTELLTGVFTKFGIDDVADIMPILPLFKVQVDQLAEYVGISKEITQKPPDPDVLPGLSDKNEFFEDEKTLDLTLFALVNGIDLKKICDKLSVDKKYVNKIKHLIQVTRHMRETPYIPEIKF